MSALQVQHIRNLSSLDNIIPTLDNLTKYIDKKINSHVGNTTKRYIGSLNMCALCDRWAICLHPRDWH